MKYTAKQNEFLSYIDEMTQFGKVSISGVRLFEMFCEKKKLNLNTKYGFLLYLQRKGIL